MANTEVESIICANSTEEALKEAIRKYDFVFPYVSAKMTDEQARNSAVATIIIASKDIEKACAPLSAKLREKLAVVDTEKSELVKVWRFVAEKDLPAGTISEENSAKVNGYIGHLIGVATPYEEMVDKIKTYITQVATEVQPKAQE